MSNDIGVVLERPDGTGIIAYRGTDPTNPYDLTADALILLGYNKEEGKSIPGSRFDNAENLYKSASKNTLLLILRAIRLARRREII